MKSVVFQAQFLRSILLWTLLGAGSVGGVFAQTNGSSSNLVTTLLPAGSVWKFWNQEGAPGPDWKSLSFDDSGWRSGPAQLGYGDGDEATITRTNGIPHPISAYFRRTVFLTSTISSPVILRLLCDDGAVVYINGAEIARDNLPEGEITHTTTASVSVGGNDENAFHQFTFPSAGLHAGTNIIAVEVHQSNPSSSDLSFDLELQMGDIVVPNYPVVSIRATQNTSEPLPNALIVPGQFVVSRLDPNLELPLRVHLAYSGTATPDDYAPLGLSVIFAPGETSTNILVFANSDNLVEGTESLVARLVSEFTANGDTAARFYTVDPGHSRAEVLIGDEDTNSFPFPIVSLETLVSETREAFPNEDVLPGRFRLRRSGSVEGELSVFLRYSGTATNGDDYNRLEDVITFPPDTADVFPFVHALDDNLVEGTETVIAELVLPPFAGPAPRYVIHPTENSGTVRIHDNDSSGRATLHITAPGDGSVFPVGQPIDVMAMAIDPEGYIPRVEFYAGERLIGVSEIAFIVAPEPGTPITHTITWSNAPAGEHFLRARAVNSAGEVVTSPEIKIIVSPVASLPVVGVRFIPHESLEPWPDEDFAPGSFEFRRTGPTNRALVVYFVVGGTADPGLDYEPLMERIEFPPGNAATRLKVEAIDDKLVEGDETVVVTLAPFRNTDPANLPAPVDYIIDPANRAATLTIIDNEAANGLARIEITHPKSGDAFPLGAPIPIDAVAVDPNGYISRVGFYADNVLIGTSVIDFIVPPEPGTPIHHSVVWENAPAGEHILRAVAADRRVASEPVRITVGPNIPERVVLEVEAIDPYASEIERDGTINDGMFAIRRVSGPTNIAVSVFYEMSGAAGNGIDYERLDGMAILRAGQRSLEVVVRPIPDQALEKDETVVLTLREPVCARIFPPPPECYLIGPKGSASAVIHNDFGGRLLPRVDITRPRDGTVFDLGEPVGITAEASDRDGVIVQLDLLVDDHLIWRTNGTYLSFIWPNAPTGHFTLRALAVDSSGATGRSERVRILVREPNSSAFVRRELPVGYLPGSPLTVHLIANPPDRTDAWAVEDQPPRGWTVSDISHEGVFDPATGKVKFGFFADDRPRTLSYELTPPNSATGPHEFEGTSSADGQAFPIGGDRVIAPLEQREHHPADVNLNTHITLVEVTGYAAAWKNGTDWPTPPNPIPLSYVTRAALIWRQGEAYHFVSAHPAPQCWVPNAGMARAFAATTSVVVRSSALETSPGSPLEVTITVEPAEGAYALEENVPPGWSVANISDDGAFDAESGLIRWGLFMDGQARALSYTLTAPPGVTSVADLHGVASFDGEVQTITGSARVIAVEDSALLRMPHCERRADGAVQLKLTGAAGQVCVLEASSDLRAWSIVEEVFLPDGELVLVDDAAAGVPRRYYRLRVR